MSDDWDPRIFADDGRLIGHVVVAEDGSGAVAVDVEGNIIDAVDADMQPVDPAEFEIQHDEPDPAVELHERLDEISARLDNPPPSPAVEQYQAGPDPDEVWGSVVNRELVNVEHALGRSLTEPEMYRVLEDSKNDLDAGVAPDIWKSAAAAGINQYVPGRDTGLSDSARSEARTRYAVELIEDQQRDESGETYSPQPKASRDSYDLDVVEQRHAWMADKVSGADVDGLEYRTSDQPEEE